MGTVCIFDALELGGHRIKGFIPGNRFELSTAPLAGPFQGLGQAQGRIYHFVLGHPPQTGFQTRAAGIVRADAYDFSAGNMGL